MPSCRMTHPFIKCRLLTSNNDDVGNILVEKNLAVKNDVDYSFKDADDQILPI